MSEKVSDGAMRAAEAVKQMEKDRIAPSNWWMNTAELAAIIERETNVSGLTEACQLSVKTIQSLNHQLPRGASPSLVDEFKKHIEAIESQLTRATKG